MTYNLQPKPFPFPYQPRPDEGSALTSGPDLDAIDALLAAPSPAPPVFTHEERMARLLDQVFPVDVDLDHVDRKFTTRSGEAYEFHLIPQGSTPGQHRPHRGNTPPPTVATPSRRRGRTQLTPGSIVRQRVSRATGLLTTVTYEGPGRWTLTIGASTHYYRTRDQAVRQARRGALA